MRVLILMTSILLIACQAAEGHPHKADKQGNEAVVSPGKPQHPLQVQLLRPESMQAGVESEVELLVNSAYRLENLSVRLKPASGMMLSEARFERGRDELTNASLRLPFKLTPAAQDQELTAFIEATMPDGRVISREVQLPLNGKRNTASENVARKSPNLPAVTPQTRDRDVVVRAEQEVIRDDDGGR